VDVNKQGSNCRINHVRCANLIIFGLFAYTMISKPFRGATVLNISQGFSNTHRALDWWAVRKYGAITLNAYGTPLCAPEKCKIKTVYGNNFVVDDTNLPNTVGSLKNGYGLWMEGLETGMMHLYWHTQPFFPVSLGDIVERGQIVAYEGDSGNVLAGGVYVPLADRNKPPYFGTHLHQAAHGKDGLPIDPLSVMDLQTEPNYSMWAELEAMRKTLLKMLGGLKK
jgi:murein DD-endopeptidase MepM/ murein hydrolase activator NlpD